jgi:hypothetical protein
VLLVIAMIVAALIAVFIILFGVAIFRRKWPIRTWVTGIMVGLIFIGLAFGGALTADVYPNIRASYNANVFTTVRPLTAFNSVDENQANAGEINVVPSSSYYVSLNYYGHPDLNSIKTYVRSGTLYIDSSTFNWHRNCQSICIPDTYNMVITIYSPNAQELINQLDGGPVPIGPGPVAPM